MRFSQRVVVAATMAVAATVISDNSMGMVHVSAFVMPQHSITQQRQKLPQSTVGRRNSDVSKMSMVPPALSGAVSSSVSLASSAVDSVTSSPLFTFFAERVIESAVPAVFSIVVIFFFFAQFKGARGDMERNEEEAEQINAVSDLYNDLYGSTRGNGILGGSGGRGGGFGRGGFQPPPLPKNLGLPKKEYIKMTSLNELYSSYDYSVRRATTSKAQAASVFRRQSFDRALNLALNADPGDGTGNDATLSGATKAKLLAAERAFLKMGKELVQEIQKYESELATLAMDGALSKLSAQEEKKDKAGSSSASVVDAEIVDGNSNVTALASTANETSSLSFLSKSSPQKKKQDELLTKITDSQKKLKKLELTFIEQVIAAVGTKRGFGLRNALLGDIQVRGTGSLLVQLEDRPLSVILNAGNSSSDGDSVSGNKRLFVMNFPGDVQASQLNELREEVTAIVRNAKPGDEALVVLQSGGGTVTGYGLAAGQLVRLKDKGLKLTIAVEQVAASGGYMMSCVADKIVASPFAVLGSIGVISEIPNFYERLKEEGISFQTVTAGKFKRTLTPTKKVSKEDMAKSKEDIESIFQLFKGWVAQNRPQLDIDEVATGETWFGPDALERGLCDEIKTVDDILLDYVDGGYSVYEVAYQPPPDVPPPLQFLFANEDGAPSVGAGARSSKANSSLGRKAIRWAVQTFAEEVQGALMDNGSSPYSGGGPTSSTKDRFMARDSSSERIKVSDEDFW
mmetsp:Transcript_45732/g.111480  ORF Transcript_45732/g.111480 Transcript_45732/m.111480 type:complete len:740 (+) Transcript_45732:123-2342(+)